MNSYIQIIIGILLPTFAAFVFIKLEQNTFFADTSYKFKQVVIGLVFGAIAIYGTENGAQINGAIMNVRDASVLTAGLVFGGPAGIIAGLISGIERYFAVYWGVGTYTRIACTVSTIFAGFYAAGIRKSLLNNKKPSIPLALAIGLVMEVFHMTTVYLTNMDDTIRASEVVKNCSIVMIPANTVGTGLSSFIDSLLTNKKDNSGEKILPTISQTIQRWLLLVVAVGFILTTAFMYRLQTAISEKQAEENLAQTINDVKQDIKSAGDAALLKTCNTVKDMLVPNITYQEIEAIRQALDVAEIDIINHNGVIIRSTNSLFVGYEMKKGEQSAEFLCLLHGENEYVQDFGPISANKNIYRKYAGVTYNMGFVQVGYDEARYKNEIAHDVQNAAKNRHIGNTGYVLIADKEGWIVSAPDNVSISSITDLNVSKALEENKIIKTKVNGEDVLCSYSRSEGYYIVAVLPNAEAHYIRDSATVANAFLEILVLALLFGMIFRLINKRVVDKIDVVNNSLHKITAGNLDEVVNVGGNIEFKELAGDINSTVDTLKKYIAEESARIDAELEYAKNIQNSVLPHVFPVNDHFELYALMDAAKEVGGDFYDFSKSDENIFNFLVADVSGKSIPGAMFMMRAKSVLASLTQMGHEVNDIFTQGNERLCDGNDAGMFVTAWEGKIDLRTGEVKYANAGHNPPVIRRKDGTCEYIKGRPGFVLAGMDGIVYKEQELKLEPGDILFLYTDGVVEATNLDKKLYGDDRLLEALAKVNTDTMQNVCDGILEDVNKFVGEAEQFDDITMVALRYKG